MKLYVVNHSNGTKSVTNKSIFIKKKNDTPTVEVVEVEDTLGAEFLDDPNAYTIGEEGVAKK